MRICDKHQEEMVLYGKKFKCKSCNREYQRKWLKDNRPTQRKRVRSNNQKIMERNRTFIIDYLRNHPCVDCGESDIVVLEFDHIRDKECAIANLLSKHVSISRIKDEIEKCVVRCANCHRRKTAWDFNWYRVS